MAGVAQSHIHDAARLCVAGVAFGDIHLDFTWNCFRLRLVCSTAWFSMLCSSMLDGRSGMFYFPTCFLLFPTVFYFACLRVSCLWSLRRCCFYHFLHVYLPACFFFPRVSACLILACLSTFFFRPAAFHTHTCGQVLVLFVVATTGRAQLRLSNAVQRRHDRFCFLHAGFHHVVPHTHLRPGAGLARGRYDRQGPTALEQTGRANCA